MLLSADLSGYIMPEPPIEPPLDPNEGFWNKYDAPGDVGYDEEPDEEKLREFREKMKEQNDG